METKHTQNQGELEEQGSTEDSYHLSRYRNSTNLISIQFWQTFSVLGTKLQVLLRSVHYVLELEDPSLLF